MLVYRDKRHGTVGSSFNRIRCPDDRAGPGPDQARRQALMTNMLSVRVATGSAVVALLFTLLIVQGRAQQAPAGERQYPYPSVRDQRGVIPPGPRVAPWISPLGDGPFLLESYEQRHIRVVVVTKGLSHPW